MTNSAPIPRTGTPTARRQRTGGLPALLFGLWAVLLAASPLALAANSVESIDWQNMGNGLMVRVEMAGPLTSQPPGFAVSSPPRVALDLPDTLNGLGSTQVEVNTQLLRSVSVVQAGNRTRLVFNLEQQAGYQTEIDGRHLLVTFTGAENAAGIGADPQVSNIATRFAEPVAPTFGSDSHGLRNIDFRRGAAGDGRIVVDLSDTGVGIDIRRQGANLLVDFTDTEMPATLERRLDVTDFGTPVQYVDAYRRGSGVRMVIEPTGNWDFSAYQADRQFIVEVKPVEAQAEGPFAEKGVYTGDKLSLNFQDVQVRALLQVIADFTGLNIVTSDSVGGNLTLRLKDVPWDQALHIILQAKGLDMRRTGNVIWIAPREELATKEKMELESQQQISELEPLHTESFRLKYQKAADMQTLLSDEKQRILSQRGSVVVDARTNTIFVQDTPSTLERVRNLLEKIDIPVRQVMIDARIVEATDGFTKQLGARLGINNQRASNIGGQNALVGGRIGATQGMSGQGDYTGSSAVTNTSGGSNSGTASTTGDSSSSSSSTGSTTSTTSTDTFGVTNSNAASTNASNTANASNSATSFSGTQSNDASFSNALTGSTSIASTLADAFNVSLPAIGIGGANPGALSLVLFGSGANRFLNLELTALQSDGRGKVISNPRVITADQQEATIEQGQEIPYQQATSSGATSVAWKKATLSLKVTPQITPDDNVIMSLAVNKDSRGENTTAGPAINTKQINTRVLVENGGTVVIGGIYEQEQQKTTTKVPFFGDLPGVGVMFRNTEQYDNKRELLIFVTPRIIQEGINW